MEVGFQSRGLCPGSCVVIVAESAKRLKKWASGKRHPQGKLQVGRPLLSLWEGVAPNIRCIWTAVWVPKMQAGLMHLFEDLHMTHCGKEGKCRAAAVGQPASGRFAYPPKPR